MNKEERITYEEFMTMFKNAPRIAYMLYDKAEDDKETYKDYIFELQERIEKAIDYIKINICDIKFMKKEYGKHLTDFEVDTTFNDIEKLLNILQGLVMMDR